MVATNPAVVWCAFLAACLGSGCADRGLDLSSAPNLILVGIDALRRDHLGVYGYPAPTSPFLDSLAESSRVYDNAYSHSSHTLYSTAALFTSTSAPLLIPNDSFVPVPGEPPEMQRLFESMPILAAEDVTLAERLRAAGFETFAIFTNPHHHVSGFDQGFEESLYLPAQKSPQHSHPYAVGPRVNAAFATWLAERDPSRPFFAYLHYMDVHNPYYRPRCTETASRRRLESIDSSTAFPSRAMRPTSGISSSGG